MSKTRPKNTPGIQTIKSKRETNIKQNYKRPRSEIVHKQINRLYTHVVWPPRRNQNLAFRIRRVVCRRRSCTFQHLLDIILAQGRPWLGRNAEARRHGQGHLDPRCRSVSTIGTPLRRALVGTGIWRGIRLVNVHIADIAVVFACAVGRRIHL